MKKVFISNGFVVGVAQAVMSGSSVSGPKGSDSVVVEDDIDVVCGDFYDGASFSRTAPIPPVPQSVTMRQARLALNAAGLLTTVNSAIAAMTGPAGEAARIEWEFSSTVERNRPLVQAMASALAMDDAAIDALFVSAAAL